MQTYNYLRKATRAIPEIIEANQEFLTQAYSVQALQLLQEAQKAVKFVLPDNGRIFDSKFKGLPSILKLPYPEILIEYQ